MTTQHNATFNELVYLAIGDASRVSNCEVDFASQHKDVDVVIEAAGERDNDIFNLGVQAGATQVLDTLNKNGYSIHSPEANVLAPAEGSSFSEDYFSRKYWVEVSH